MLLQCGQSSIGVGYGLVFESATLNLAFRQLGRPPLHCPLSTAVSRSFSGLLLAFL